MTESKIIPGQESSGQEKSNEKNQEQNRWNKIVAIELGLPTSEEGSSEKENDEQGDANFVTRPPKDICGLALSGGGIRSATFNLGLLQGLNRHKILEQFDYLSTVSGGGYIGGFWTAWRSRNQNSGRLFPGSQRPENTAADTETGSEESVFRHLREFSNFLVPRLGLFSVDTGRIVASFLAAVIPSLIFTVFTLTLLLSFYKILIMGFEGVLFDPPTDILRFVGILAGFITIIVLAGSEAIWPERLTLFQIIIYILIGFGTALLVACFALYFYLSINTDVLLPVVWAGVAAILFVLKWLLSRVIINFEWQTIISTISRISSRLLYAAAVWMVFWGVWWSAEITYEFLKGQEGIVAVITSVLAVISGIFARIQLLIGRSSVKPQEEAFTSRLKPYVPQVLAYVAAGILFVMAGVLLIALFNILIPWEPQIGEWVLFKIYYVEAFMVFALGVSLVGILLMMITMEPNQVSLHNFYRSRIARAYLGASLDTSDQIEDKNGKYKGRRFVEEREEDDRPLTKCNKDRPLHLICCAANDLGSKNVMSTLYRGAESSVLSPKAFSVGSTWKPWDKLPFQSPSLGASLTASAAALNSHMGSMSMRLGPAVRFLMTALNLRLGLWWPSPEGKGKSWIRKIFPGWAFFREMLGLSSVKGNELFLSDGGHFENLALYELIRRHARYVIVSDCGMDSDVLFDDFGNLVRKVRADFGVEIQIDLSPLKPGKEGYSRQCMVAGDIHYPGGDTGILLFFKPTLTGNEPADVMQYHNRNSRFPHESTGDQFYDEAQWEAYRKLGEHAAETALGSIMKKLKGVSVSGEEELKRRMFTQARRDWLPTPKGYADRVSRFTSKVAELDALLTDSNCHTLQAEVFKEVPELDSQMKTGEAPKREAGSGNNGNGAMAQNGETGRALQIIRRAVHFMEEVYLHENLEKNHNHPLYVGTMNYFARWTLAPTFRMWWPVVKSMYPQQFTRFIEAHYNLKAADPSASIGVVNQVEGFAAVSWDENRTLRDHEHIVQYSLNLRNRDKVYTISAAFVILAKKGSIAVWKSDELRVPPGLWATGIGSDFVSQLLKSELFENNTGDVKPVLANEILVRIAIGEHEDPAKLRSRANEIYFYRSAGFREVTNRVAEEILESNGLLEYYTTSDEQQGKKGLQSKWMYLSV